MDGDTSGLQGFEGPIGQQLSVDHQTLKIADNLPVKVQPISFAKSEIFKLSTNQEYLLLASNAVILGKNLLKRSSPDILHHARWLTTANQPLGVYISVENLEENLQRLIDYVQKVCYGLK